MTFLFTIAEISRVTLEFLSIRCIYYHVVRSAEQFRERIEFDMKIEREREKKGVVTHAIFVTYTLVWMNGIMYGEAYGMFNTILYSIHDKKNKKMRRKERRTFRRIHEERRDRNFPSGIFVARKAAGKEISSCIFLQAADISQRLWAHVAPLRDFASLDSLLFVRHGGYDETRDRQTDRQEKRVRATTVSATVSNLQDVSDLYSRYLIKINWHHPSCCIRELFRA